MTGPNTPGFRGYVGALALASVALSIGVWAADSFGDIGPFGAVYLFLLYSALLLGVPLLLLALPWLVAQLVCRRVADQRVHVAVTAMAYLAPVVVALPWLGSPERQLGFGLAGAMALGRAAAIPLVNERRRRFAAETLGRVA